MGRADQLAPLTAFIEVLLHAQLPAQRKQTMRKVANALLKFNRDRITKQVNPDGSAWEKRKRGSSRLLLGMRKRMKTVVTGDKAEVGFAGRDAYVARVHQEGWKIPVVPGGPKYRYPIRMTLGLTETDIEAVKQLILEAVA